jgi:hypothetical protein
MDDMSREMGRRSGCFTHAEGWRRHLHLGLARDDHDLLSAELGAGATVPGRSGELP